MNVDNPTTSTRRGSNQSGLRAHNERLVLSLIRYKGALSKAEIARLTGLSAQTVSVIMRGLEADGLLKKGEPVRGKVGQPLVPMDLDKTGAYFIGLKVGRRSVDMILTDFLGNVLQRIHHTHKYPTPDGVLGFANSSIEKLLSTLSPTQRDRVAGLGIAIPFKLWEWAAPLGVALESMADWKTRDIAAELSQIWDFPVYLQNDASSACGAELVFGNHDKPADFLYFFIGFFIGAGLVLDNALYTGPSGNAAAMGPMPVTTRSGEQKLLIDVASLASLEREYVKNGGDSENIWGPPSEWDVPDNILQPWIKTASDGIASAILSAACLLDTECVIIDGWIPDNVRAEIVTQINQRLNEHPVTGIDIPKVREGSIGHYARSLGAASLPLSERYLIERTGIANLIG